MPQKMHAGFMNDRQSQNRLGNITTEEPHLEPLLIQEQKAWNVLST